MRRLIPVVVFAALMLMWGGCRVVAQHRADAAAAAPWPLQLGGLRDVPSRWPKRNASPAALALGPLEARVGIRLNLADKRPDTNEERAVFAVRASLHKWLDAEMATAADRDVPPPADVAEFIDAHRADIDALRDHVLGNERAIEWPVDLSAGMDAPMPNLLAHMSVSRLLVATALRRASWDHLHATWILTRVMWRRPEVLSQLIAVATTRLVCAAARRLPAPAPPWFSEVAQYDYVTPIAAAQQVDAWLVFTYGAADIAGKTFVRRVIAAVDAPATLLFSADVANRERAVLEHFVALRECAIDGAALDARTVGDLPAAAIYTRIVMPQWGVMWQRIARLRAEVELAQRVVILKSRGWSPSAPDLATSACSDGSWRYANGELTFSREIASRGAPFPLRYSR